MGRRSSHKPDELREMIVAAATELIEGGGLAALSARQVARKVGYSPGTIYNFFDDLDDLIATIEHRLLDRLAARLTDVPACVDPVQHLCDLAHSYLAFTQERPRLWNLLFEHHMPDNGQTTFSIKLEALLDEVEKAITPLAGSDRPGRHARVLWASVHGITSLATAEKLSNVTPDNAAVLVEDLVRTYAAGLKATRKRAPKQ
jgi:AcrR family transcriptional regulator